MKDEHLQQIADEIIKTGKADIEYIETTEQSKEYKKGWKEGIDQIVLELLGRKSEDEVEKLKEIIK